jgi:hypothetical protein
MKLLTFSAAFELRPDCRAPVRSLQEAKMLFNPLTSLEILQVGLEALPGVVGENPLEILE